MFVAVADVVFKVAVMWWAFGLYQWQRATMARQDASERMVEDLKKSLRDPSRRP